MSMKLLFAIVILSSLVALAWNDVPIIKESVHAALDPSVGVLLDWHLNLGFFIIVFFFTLLTTLLQKYTTDQATLKQHKEEQKQIQKEMRDFKDNPEKMLELQKKSFDLMFKIMHITMRPALYTLVPFILFLRWFGDYFSTVHDKIFGIFSGWIWAYILASIIISIPLRKILNVH